MLLYRYVYLLAGLLLSSFVSPAQTRRIDSLRENLQQTVGNENELHALLALCEENESLNKDSLFNYAVKAKAYATALHQMAEERLADYYLAYSYYRKGMPDTAYKILAALLPAAGQRPLDKLRADLLLLKGRCLVRMQQYKEALPVYYTVLNEAEAANDTLNQMKAMSGIGWTLNRTGDNKGALHWFLRGISLSASPAFRNKTIYLYTNAAVIYNSFGRYDSSEYYVQKAIGFARKAENLSDLAGSLGMHAGNMMDMGTPAAAEKPLQEALDVTKKIGDPNDVITQMGTLAAYYTDINQPQKSIGLCLKAIDLVNQYQLPAKLFFLYDMLARGYKAAGLYKEYGETLDRLLVLKDSAYTRNSAEAMAELQTRYEVQKKENTIIQQRLNLVKKDYLIYFSSLFFLLTLCAAFFGFRSYRKRQRLKSRLAVTSAEEKERKRIAADLHDNLGAYAASIASNLNRIHLPAPAADENSLALDEIRQHSKAIVSDLSDTIWALKKEALALTAISDRLKTFIQRLQPSYPGVSIEIQEHIEIDHLLTPSQGFHLFQTIQEAVNNALKHSHGRHVHVYIEGTAEQWKISIADDGTGLPAGETSGEGNGLYNMRNRAAEAGWDIEWKRQEPSGTAVIIQYSLDSTR